MKYMRFVATVLFLSITNLGFISANDAVKVICDFEDEHPLAGWEVQRGEIGFELSRERAASGRSSLKITCAPSGWRTARLALGERDAGDWRGFDVFEMDLYVDGSRSIPEFRVYLDAEDTSSTSRTFVSSSHRNVPDGRWLRYSIPLRSAPGEPDRYGHVDRENIVAVRIMLPSYIPLESETDIYIDDLRLINRLPERLAALQSKLETMLNSGQLSGDELDNVHLLLLEAEKPAEQFPETPAKLEALSRRIQEIEDRTLELSKKVMHRSLPDTSLERMAALLTGLGMAGREHPILAPSSEFDTPESELDLEARALDLLAVMTREFLEDERVRIDARRFFAEADFAVGVPEYPRAWNSDRYSGPVSGEVRIQGARHEHEPFQVVVLATGDDLKNVRVTASALNGDAGKIPAENLEIAPMGWRKRLDAPTWVADMLRPDIGFFDVDSGAHQPVWINVYIPPETPPGDYRGTVVVSADGVCPIEIPVFLTVWPFTLPDQPSFKSAGSAPLTGKLGDEFVRFLISRRWNPHRLYINRPDSGYHDYDTFRKWHEWGGTFFNLLWLNHSYKDHPDLVERDNQGRLTGASEKAKGQLFAFLDPIIDEITARDPDFLREFVVYGFDEPQAKHMPVLEDLFGALKERYGPELRTYFAVHYPDVVSEWHNKARNIDIWAVLTSRAMTPEERDRLKATERELITYNIGSSSEDPVATRVQFWRYFKDGLDGVLHYNPHYGGEGGRAAGPWEKTLFPREERTDGGVHRYFPGEDRPRMSTVAFEYWREGLEDVDYLYLLRSLRDRLAADAAGGDERQRLIRLADRMLNIPDSITTGGLREDGVEGEIISRMNGTTDDMQVILNARRVIAGLISTIQEMLSDSGQ